MTDAAQALFSKALALPPVERAALIEELLSSFDRPERASIDSMWAVESEERLNAFEKGEIETHTLEDAVKTINRQ